MKKNTRKDNMAKKQQKNQTKKYGGGLLRTTATSIEDSSFVFYLAFVSIIVQFIHNLLAVAGTFDLFVIDEAFVLFLLEWLLAITIAAVFAASLFYFTIKAGSIDPDKKRKDHTKEPVRRQQKKYNQIVWGFAIFDTLLDFYFWVYIVFMNSNIGGVTDLYSVMQERWILLIVIIPIVVYLPQTLRFYAREIELSKFVEDK
jgi:hypothetical protein